MVYLSQTFPSHLFWVGNLFLSSYVYYKNFFDILSGRFSINFSNWFNATVAAYGKHLVSWFARFIVAF